MGRKLCHSEQMPFLTSFRFSNACLMAGLCALSLVSCHAAGPYPDVMTIGEIQGEMNLEADPTDFRSDFLKETVQVRGVVHQILRGRSSDGTFFYSALIQNTPQDSDRNPATSDGLLVFLGDLPSLPRERAGEYTVRIGEKVTLKGQVEERYGQTELSDAVVLRVEQGPFLDELEVRTLETLPARVWDRNWILETLEGMRVRLPEGMVTVAGTHPNNRTGDLNLWTVLPSHPVAKREDAASRRLYRPFHDRSHLREETVQEHGQVLVLGQLGAETVVEEWDAHAMPPVHAGSVIANPLEGGVVYSWGEYVIMPSRLPVIEDVGPSPSSLPEESAEEDCIRVAAYNVENLYDYRNDPFDGCDFAGDEGCPDVRRPFNYVPASDEVYQQRLDAIARQIVEQLHSPDILLIQEVEDQDIGVLTVAGMVYGQTNHADGEVDALQELAIRIVALGGPVYRTAIDRDGADGRGITCAWMYNPETVLPAPAERHHPLLSASPPLPESLNWMPLTREASNPKAFNAEYTGVDSGAELTQVFSRPAQLMQFERVADGRTLYITNNHFSSGPDRRVERRTFQARVNAALASVLLGEDPSAWVIVGGDLNVFPRPDDPLDPPSDQLGPLYNAGLINVHDQVMRERPSEAYSYIWRGVASTLDHLFVSPAVNEHLTYAGYLKLNAGAPEAFSWQPPLRASDHDPVIVELK